MANTTDSEQESGRYGAPAADAPDDTPDAALPPVREADGDGDADDAPGYAGPDDDGDDAYGIGAHVFWGMGDHTRCGEVRHVRRAGRGATARIDTHDRTHRRTGRMVEHPTSALRKEDEMDATPERPVRETETQHVDVREAVAREARGVRLRNVQIMSAGPGNGQYGNTYTPEAVQALVPEIKRQSKAFLDHSLPSEVKERGHRSLRDWAGCYDKATVQYDPVAQACVADLIVRPSIYDDIVAPVLEAGDNLGISVDGVGHCPDTPRVVRGWTRFNSADLVPAGGARGFIVREAESPAQAEADKEFVMGMFDTLTATEVREGAPALWEDIGKQYATDRGILADAQARTTGATNDASVREADTRITALETRVREAEERAAASDARVSEMEAERARTLWAQHVSAYVRECGVTTDGMAQLVAERFAGATVGGPDSPYAAQADLEADVKATADRYLAAAREAATPAPPMPRGQIVGMGAAPVREAARPAYATPANADKALLAAVDALIPPVPAGSAF